MLDPAVVVLEEPTAHQDEAHVAQVLAAVRRCAGAGTAVLVATHDAVVLEAADRVVPLADGRTAPRTTDGPPPAWQVEGRSDGGGGGI